MITKKQNSMTQPYEMHKPNLHLSAGSLNEDGEVYLFWGVESRSVVEAAWWALGIAEVKGTTLLLQASSACSRIILSCFSAQ